MIARNTTEEKDPQTCAIIGAAMEVHRQLGHGFSEKVYQEALAVESAQRQLPYERELVLVVKYKGIELTSYYKPDFIFFGEVIVEIKAISKLTSADEGQVINYLKATGLRRGLVLNFGTPSLEFKRVVFG